jgi:hypothetical protein
MRCCCLLVLIATSLAANAPTPPIHFRQANSDVHIPVPGSDSSEKKYIIQQMSGGVALFDCDNDDSSTSRWSTTPRSITIAPPVAISWSPYHQDAGFTFSDITKSAGLNHRGWSMGIAVADYDNDGLLDLYVTGYNGNVLYHNLGGCKFADVTAKSGLGVGGFSTGAAWADYDRDGHVDLFVSRYIHSDVEKLGAITTNYKGLAVEAPWGMHGESDFLFRNRGDGTFEDVSKKAGVDDPEGRLGLGGLGRLRQRRWPDSMHQ